MAGVKQQDSEGTLVEVAAQARVEISLIDSGMKLLTDMDETQLWQPSHLQAGHCQH